MESVLDTYTPSEKYYKQHYKYAYFDTETVDENGQPILDATGKYFYVGVVRKDKKTYNFEDRQDMADFILSEEKRIFFAHNLKYDYGVLFQNPYDKIGKERIKVITMANRLFSVEHYDYKVEFRDTNNFFNSKLEDLGHSVGLEKGNTIESLKNKQTALKYCENDVLIIEKIMGLLLEEFSMFNYLPLTISSLSNKYFRMNYLKNPIKFNTKYDNFFKKSYYGGRTEAFKRTGDNLYYYDFNSVYPSVLINGAYPNPETYQWIKNPSEEIILDTNFEGVAYVKMKVNMQNIPPLPYRTEDKLLFPTGTFEGWYNLNEIRNAVLYGNSHILNIKQLFIANKIIGNEIFNNYIGDLYEKRLKAKAEKDKVKDYFYKILMNGFYGKFGEMQECRLVSDIKPIEKNQNVYWKTIPLNDDFSLCQYILMRQKTDKPVKFRQPHTVLSLASYTTSLARVKLWEAMYNIELQGGTVYYCDTDSIITDIELPTSSKIGELKLEKYGSGIFHAPKCYKFIDKETNKTDIKVKGVPQRFVTELQDQYNIEKLVGLKEQYRRGIPAGTPIQMVKNLHKDVKKRIWEDNNSRPLRI